MKTRTPLDRTDLKIKKHDRVLEVGSGHNPTYRSNVLAEKFVESNYHRSTDIKIFPHQEFIHTPGENLPFSDKEFDYAICCQVLEHAEDPVQFVREQTRVAKRGYMETPSLIGEVLFPKESHKWAVLEIDNKLVLYEKSKMPGNFKTDFGELFLSYLPYQSIAWHLLRLTHGNIVTIRYEWENDIDILVNPEDDYYRSFFTRPWTPEMIRKIFPPRSKRQEINMLLKSATHAFKNSLKNKWSKHTPLTMLEYTQQRNTGHKPSSNF